MASNHPPRFRLQPLLVVLALACAAGAVVSSYQNRGSLPNASLLSRPAPDLSSPSGPTSESRARRGLSSADRVPATTQVALAEVEAPDLGAIQDPSRKSRNSMLLQARRFLGDLGHPVETLFPDYEDVTPEQWHALDRVMGSEWLKLAQRRSDASSRVSSIVDRLVEDGIAKPVPLLPRSDGSVVFQDALGLIGWQRGDYVSYVSQGSTMSAVLVRREHDAELSQIGQQIDVMEESVKLRIMRALGH